MAALDMIRREAAWISTISMAALGTVDPFGGCGRSWRPDDTAEAAGRDCLARSHHDTRLIAFATAQTGRIPGTTVAKRIEVRSGAQDLKPCGEHTTPSAPASASPCVQIRKTFASAGAPKHV